ncbi:MAG: HNH endonuclease [Sedimentisphaerales bacterium]|nr:HNH endonuclease [Sedimentisphaerales bacterium]
MSGAMLKLKNGSHTLVDPDVYERFKDQTLCGRGYVKFYIKRRTLYLHREIMHPPEGLVVDHINGNPFDNRRANLRVVTQSENHINRHKKSRSMSGYRWVFFDRRGKRHWCVRHTDKNHRQRYFFSRHVGGLLVDELLQSSYEVPGRLNFPKAVRRSALRDFIEKTNGLFFSVVFSRRSNGRQRRMVCRTSGGEPWTNPPRWNGSEHNIVIVKEAGNGFRCIPLEGVLCLTFKGERYRITE